MLSNSNAQIAERQASDRGREKKEVKTANFDFKGCASEIDRRPKIAEKMVNNKFENMF